MSIVSVCVEWREFCVFRFLNVFAHSNYLIDESIRVAMGITVKNHVIILDEAHNIESACRDAASHTIVTADLYARMNASCCFNSHLYTYLHTK
jgi:hypothetical protein